MKICLDCAENSRAQQRACQGEHRDQGSCGVNFNLPEFLASKLVASGQAGQESQRKDQEIKKLEDLREADSQRLRDEKITAVKELEEKHRQNTGAAHKKSGEALMAELDNGKEIGEKDESIKNKSKPKEDNKKANKHQQETTRQAAKEKKEEQERKEEEHKTEVDRLSKERTSIAASAGVMREKLAQVEAKVETLSKEKVVPLFLSCSHWLCATRWLTASSHAGERKGAGEYEDCGDAGTTRIQCQAGGV